MSEKPKTVKINFGIPAWLDERMRERAPIRKRGDLEKFFTKLLIREFGDLVPEVKREETPPT